ncbi:hypothetical protein ACPCAE_12565 [Streptomyces cinereoruber]|uniref:hypothetical protein n=1 Tax=Streptomyces cinereoruber TaxID=67260 RepID=UPI003C2C21BE
MSRFKSAAATMALAGLLAGCSQSEPKATPELPERVCWGAFSGPEVNRILAPAEKVDHQADQFLLAEADDDASCRILADRVPSFVATAELLDFEGSAEREIWWFPDALPSTWAGPAPSGTVVPPRTSPVSPPPPSAVRESTSLWTSASAA